MVGRKENGSLTAPKIQNNLDWFGFLVVLMCLALLLLMGFAMFSTQGSRSGNRFMEQYGPADQFQQFQQNVDKAVDRAFGEIL